MTRLVVPLTQATLWHTGEVCLRAFLDLELRDASGNWQAGTFRVDPGSDMTSFSAARARTLGLPMPAQGLLVPLTTAAGAAVVHLRAGFLRIRVVGMDPVEYFIPCHFLGDPNAPLPQGVATPAFPRSLLALTGVADKLRFEFDATPNPPTEPHGHMVVERL